jgi:hypothetical protein
MRAERVLETCLYAVARSSAEGFYARVLGLEPQSRKEVRHAFLRCRDAMVLLFRAQETQKRGGDVRRLALLRWASRAGAWVVEDDYDSDYDSEYRYSGRPLEALQGLDSEGRVVYFGTFSKVLFPA